jgi:RimJ/RimL family protein N-acetyltransferase
MNTNAAEWNSPLQTPRLRLEPQVEAHAKALMHALGDARTHLFVPSDPPTDAVAFAERLKRLETRLSSDGLQRWLNWTVFLEGTAIGTVQADTNPSGTMAGIAYMFHPDSWGKGLAFEACTAMLGHLRSRGITAFNAWVDTRNDASQRLLTRLGFTQTERIEHADEFKGSISHEFVYTLEVSGGDRG